MKTVWVIEQGSYSDYHVVGVFTSEANAKMVAEKINAADSWEKATVAEWPLNPAVEDLNAGRSQWLVHMLKNGDTERVEPRDFSTYELAGHVSVWERTKAPAYAGKGIPDILTATVWATDKDHALKIVNEHRLAMIAAGKF